MRSSIASRRGRLAAWVLFAAASAANGQTTPTASELWKTRASTDARRVVEWVLQAADHGGRPFAVVDKRSARIHVFDGHGRLVGQTAVLLGETVGDHTVPGVGERAQTGTVRPDERTTPAGRFESQPGRNLKGEHVIWVDPESAFAIHRVRPGRSERSRRARLATQSPDDNRASLGCVVVPVHFYKEVIEPTLGRTRSIVYVLPEAGPLQLPFGDASAV